jgi:riboflavin synthase
MFTGIIETLGTVQEIKKDKDNLHITLASTITDELQIDQSLAHNGICMTVVAINKNLYTVTAIGETVKKTNIS